MIKRLLMGIGLCVSSVALSAQNYVLDPHFSDYRHDKGASHVWIVHEDSEKGLGEVGSSGDTAFGEQGSARFRFKKNIAVHDFSATPGLSQVLTHLPNNQKMQYSLYYCDKKGLESPSHLYFGVREYVNNLPLSGKVIADKHVHFNELKRAPKGSVVDCFRQVSLDFNSGKTGKLEIFSVMEVDASDPEKIDMYQEVEIRVDAFSVTIK